MNATAAVRTPLYELGDLTKPEYVARRAALQEELAGLAPEPSPNIELVGRARRLRRLLVGCAKSGSCGQAVFMDESAEPVSALHGGRGWVQDPQLPGRR